MSGSAGAQEVLRLFGFTLTRNPKDDDKSKDNKTQQSFIAPSNDDGALNISSAAYYGTYVDLDGSAKNEIELITRYREMSMQPEVETAIDDIVNESIIADENGVTVKLVLDDLQVPSNIKKLIAKEFEVVQKLYSWRDQGQDIYRRWYVDGRLFYNVIIDKANPTSGIKELRYIDPRKIRKIREIKKEKDGNTGIDIITSSNEYYIYNDKVQSSGGSGSSSLPGIRIAKDSIINVNSGLMDSRRASVLSYLHKAIKPLNQLRMVEDATVIYRLSRAPERRIFYVDVGDLPKAKAEQYMNDIMTKYKNKLVYDSETGQVRDDRKFLSMLEDFWLPRRGGNKSTEIDTLSGGENLGVMEDVVYFEKKLYKSLSVPIGRLDSHQGFSLGRTGEITRDELKFSRFVDRLRNRFVLLFDQALKIQCVLKGICTLGEWEEFREYIQYDFTKDNFFTEMKEAEIMKERLGLLGLVNPYVGQFYSNAWVRKKVLRMTDLEIKLMDKEIQEEQAEQDELMAQQEGGPQDQNSRNQQSIMKRNMKLVDPYDHQLNVRANDTQFT
jgi:Bacteriophage T4-like portal protein (Gp20)